MEHLEKREILCVDRPTFLTVSAAPVFKSLRERIQCLYNDVVDRLCVATSQSIIDRSDQMLRHDTIQLVLIRVPIVHSAYCLASHHGET